MRKSTGSMSSESGPGRSVTTCTSLLRSRRSSRRSDGTSYIARGTTRSCRPLRWLQLSVHPYRTCSAFTVAVTRHTFEAHFAEYRPLSFVRSPLEQRHSWPCLASKLRCSAAAFDCRRVGSGSFRTAQTPG
jgi:hypothetical protein